MDSVLSNIFSNHQTLSYDLTTVLVQTMVGGVTSKIMSNQRTLSYDVTTVLVQNDGRWRDIKRFLEFSNPRSPAASKDLSLRNEHDHSSCVKDRIIDSVLEDIRTKK